MKFWSLQMCSLPQNVCSYNKFELPEFFIILLSGCFWIHSVFWIQMGQSFVLCSLMYFRWLCYLTPRKFCRYVAALIASRHNFFYQNRMKTNLVIVILMKRMTKKCYLGHRVFLPFCHLFRLITGIREAKCYRASFIWKQCSISVILIYKVWG